MTKRKQKPKSKPKPRTKVERLRHYISTFDLALENAMLAFESAGPKKDAELLWGVMGEAFQRFAALTFIYSLNLSTGAQVRHARTFFANNARSHFDVEIGRMEKTR